jgi:hypothetical protein
MKLADSASGNRRQLRIAASFRICAALLLALGLGMAGGVARASTITFTYNGAGSPDFDPGAMAAGSGFFTIDDSNDPAGIGDLSNFSFSLSVAYGGYTDTYTYGLSDLTSFQANFTGGALTDLALTTDHQPAAYNWNEGFNVTDLGAGDAYTDDGDGDQVSIGTVTVGESSTPEPTSLALIASGLLGLAAARRRRTAR